MQGCTGCGFGPIGETLLAEERFQRHEIGFQRLDQAQAVTVVIDGQPDIDIHPTVIDDVMAEGVVTRHHETVEAGLQVRKH